MNIPETKYTKKSLEARRRFSPKPGIYFPGFAAETRQMPHFRSKVVGPCIDFQRVASSRLPDPSFAYIYTPVEA